MNGLLRRLRALRQPIRVAIVGVGAMGRGLAYQISITPGIECVALADVKLERASDCARQLQASCTVVADEHAAADAVKAGRLALCEDGAVLARCPAVDVLVDATSAIEGAVGFCTAALEHGKHLIMMNAEADLAFGPALMRLAKRHGVVYSTCDGDQPGVLTRLVDDARLWGLDLVLVGNIKGFLDRYANPTSIVPEADKRRLDYRMATGYTDGTKLAIEMALLANGIGLAVPVLGMRGPRARTVHEALTLFDCAALRALREPCVDYVLGAEPGGGVFCVVHCDEPYQRFMLQYYKLGDGPFYVLYRPYHLCHVEAMACIAEAALDGQALLQPEHGRRAEVYAWAKRDLRAGDRLDGLGGYDCYGLIAETASAAGRVGLPICLSEGVRLTRDVARDQPVTLAHVAAPAARADWRLWAEADGRGA
ncbi:MAG: homoserine dehydrogenase [Chloroflexi bacterium]|nr:homoserine dehydrogenase [Chloroflexota bacterium]